MALPKNIPPEPADPAPPEPGGPAEPEWARELKQLVNDLPSKLRATVTDDDKRSIGEYVHGLFEKSGAFEPPPPKEGEEEDPTAEPDPPAGGGNEPEPGGDSIARRWFGRW